MCTRELEKIIQSVKEQFPFQGYMDGLYPVYISMAKTVMHYLEPGSKILDFGSGPCDKTGVLQSLGYECSAYDDLQDHWHLIEGNREKICSFARKLNINFRLADNDILPFQMNYFDMLMMHDVLEHLHDSPRNLLNNLLALVKPEGLLFVTVPNAVNIRKRIRVVLGKTNLPNFDHYYWHPDPWRGHVREYTSCHHMLQKVPPVILPLYLTLTSIFSGWRDSWMLVAKKKNNLVPKNLCQERNSQQYVASMARSSIRKSHSSTLCLSGIRI